MRHRLRILMASLLLLFVVASPAAAPATALTTPPSPVQPLGYPGSWYVGMSPPNADPSKPVLVFVHGKGGSAAAWWAQTAYHGTNDMYAYAYNNGHRTAFVDLEPEGDMWANGVLLHQQLSEITAHFGVEKVVVIAHSKGGVDVNAATAFFGAGPDIEKVITLGSPNWGTPLADLAYSTWTWWLAALLGYQSDATYVLQTGYMAWFRSAADGAGDTVPYYTVGGRTCGPFLTALWWGCIYLAGEDDGVVPMDSSHKPGATIVADGWWDHDEIRMGSRTWGPIAGLLQPSGAPTRAADMGTTSGAGSFALTNVLARGGETLGATAGQPFPLESGVRKMSLAFYASSPAFTATLTGPDGSTHTVKMQGQVPGGEVFAGAWVGSLELERPAAGEWRFETAAPGKAGYLMLAALDSDVTARLKTGSLVAAPGSTKQVTVTLSRVPASAQVSGVLSEGGHQLATFAGRQANVTLPQQEGIHNLTVTVTGRLADGTAFERTLVGSIAVAPQGTTAPWTGR